MRVKWTRAELIALREAIEITPNFEGRQDARDILRVAVRAPRVQALELEQGLAERLANRLVPALGGSQEDRPWFHPNELARRWAATLEGTPRYLHAPAFVSSALKRSLVHEEGVHSTLDLWDRAKVALVGIGA